MYLLNQIQNWSAKSDKIFYSRCVTSRVHWEFKCHGIHIDKTDGTMYLRGRKSVRQFEIVGEIVDDVLFVPQPLLGIFDAIYKMDLQ